MKKILLIALCATLLFSCSEDLECLHCAEGFFATSSGSEKTISSSSNSFPENSSSSESLPDCDGVEYNPKEQFCDERDNNLYKYVTLYGQKWMAENLRYNDCEQNFCGILEEQYGVFYVPNQVTDELCPSGWQLSSINEFNSLAGHGNPDELKSEHGFAALFAGYYIDLEHTNEDNVGSWYYMDGEALKTFQLLDGNFKFNDDENENEMHNIRCVKREIEN